MLSSTIADPVLVVDMDHARSSTLAELLRREGWSVCTSRDAVDALRALDGQSVDLVAMGGDGSRGRREALIRQMRAAFPEIAILCFGPPTPLDLSLAGAESTVDD
jgi:DNA-binding response OmpR family regulator